MTVSPGWAIELVGEKPNLDDFEMELARPHTVWVERDGEMLLLRSTTWASLHESGAVMDEGRRLIEQLNGAARLVHDDAQQVRLGALRRFKDNGQPMSVTISTTLNITLGGCRVRARAVVAPEPATVQGPSLMQRAIAAADKDASNNRAELLLHIARTDNWFDLYKAMELAEAIKGGEYKFKKALLAQGLGNDCEVWKGVRKTANHYRHAPPKANALPSDPPATSNEGLNRILPIIRRVVRGEL